jgi:tRNA A37 threonylcarbamoyladenosine synthetase subunit TsaC/SUA5/YrdC
MIGLEIFLNMQSNSHVIFGQARSLLLLIEVIALKFHYRRTGDGRTSVSCTHIALGLIQEFIKLGGKGIAAPSANRFGAVSPTTAEAVEEELAQYLKVEDIILDGELHPLSGSGIHDCRLHKRNTFYIAFPGAVAAEIN